MPTVPESFDPFSTRVSGKSQDRLSQGLRSGPQFDPGYLLMAAAIMRDNQQRNMTFNPTPMEKQSTNGR